MACSTVNLAQIRTRWDAAMTTYVASRAGTLTNFMSLGTINLASPDNTGLWDPTAVPAIDPNSCITLTFTDGTRTVQFTYEDLGNPYLVQEVMDGLFPNIVQDFLFREELVTCLTDNGYGVVAPAVANDDGEHLKALIECLTALLRGPYSC